jgi:hypothetical protein
MQQLWLFIAFALIISIVIEAITEIIVESEFPLALWAREFATGFAIPKDDDLSKIKWYHNFFYKLLTCGYCCSIWIAFGCSFFIPDFQLNILNNIVVKTFLLHRLSNWWHSAFELFRRGRVHTYDLNVIRERKDDNDAS